MINNSIPSSFTLGGRTWNVVRKETINNGRTFGLWLDNKAEIHLAENVFCDTDTDKLEAVNEYQLENTFWHEIGHLFQYYSTGHTDDTFAQTFATFMTELINSKK